MDDLLRDFTHALDPAEFARHSLAITPDPWQERVLQWRGKRLLLNCTRQAGKSTTTAILALHQAVYWPDSLILLISPSLRQSGELFRKVQHHLEALGAAAPKRTEDNKLSCIFENGSRIVSLPSSEATIRGFSKVALLIEDEAAYVPDELHAAVRPMLAVSDGKLILMSTPYGKRGHFYEAWDKGEAWDRVRITGWEVPRIAKEFLEAEKRAIGGWRFKQEYECEFVDTLDAVFASRDIDRAFSEEVLPLF